MNQIGFIDALKSDQ